MRPRFPLQALSFNLMKERQEAPGYKVAILAAELIQGIVNQGHLTIALLDVF